MITEAVEINVIEMLSISFAVSGGSNIASTRTNKFR